MTMAGSQGDIQDLSPQDLITNFSKSRIVLWAILAIILHVVVIGGSSYEHIYYNYINKEAGRIKADKEKAEKDAAAAEETARKQAEKDAAAAAAAAKKPEDGTAAGDAGKEAVKGTPARELTEEEKLLDKHKNTQIVKDITETAAPEEIPGEPDDLIIDIDETNPE